MSEQKPKKPISFEHLGGKKVHDGAIAKKPGKPIDFSHIGGKRVDQGQRLEKPDPTTEQS